MTYPLLHVGDDFLHIGDLLAGELVVLGRVQRCQVDLLRLQLELGAVDGGLELLGSLVPHTLVDRLGFGIAVLVLSGGDGREFQSERQLVVSLGENLGVFRVELLLVLERGARVLDGVGVPATCQRGALCVLADRRLQIPLVLKRDLGEEIVCVAQPLLNMSDGRRIALGCILALAGFLLLLLLHCLQSLQVEDARQVEDLKGYAQVVIVLAFLTLGSFVLGALNPKPVSKRPCQNFAINLPPHRIPQSSRRP